MIYKRTKNITWSYSDWGTFSYVSGEVNIDKSIQYIYLNFRRGQVKLMHQSHSFSKGLIGIFNSEEDALNAAEEHFIKNYPMLILSKVCDLTDE